MKTLKSNIARNLTTLRQLNKYSQEDVAEQIGVSRQAVAKWESGQGKPEIDNIVKLTEIYDVSADYILFGTEKVSVPVPEKKELSHEYKKAIGIIAIIAATAIVTVLFITALGLLSRLGI